LAQALQVPAASELFDRVSQTPAVQSLARRLGPGGALSCAGMHAAAQPFLAALVRHIFPTRPIVVVTGSLKAQESFQQDLTTWLQTESRVRSPEPKVQTSLPSTPNPQPLFYPAWEVLPHEGKLPHADIISDRLATLVALASDFRLQTSDFRLVVTSVTALLQKTFGPKDLRSRIRVLTRGDRSDPLDLVEWLEEQGYEPEAQVSQKGEIALRGGILDVFAPTSPWPVRMEFFGDELESLRYFDPFTQISREEITNVTLPPAGELGILKQELERGVHAASPAASEHSRDVGGSPEERSLKRAEARAPLATLLDYLPRQSIFLLCDPEQLSERADEYAQQVPAGDPFFITWEAFLADLDERSMTRVEVFETPNDLFPLPPALSPGGRENCPPPPGKSASDDRSMAAEKDEADRLLSPSHEPPRSPLPPHPALSPGGGEGGRRPGEGEVHGFNSQTCSGKSPSKGEGQDEGKAAVEIPPALKSPIFSSLDAFRPLGDRAADPQIAEAQRREFFDQLHRWLRQGYAVHVFCNNDGERQRFGEIWNELGLSPQSSVHSPQSDECRRLGTENSGLWTEVGTLSRGFLCDEARLVVVTDAEIFGRYRVQRPRRLKSPHAAAMRSALEIDFADLEGGDFVVHLQHGIGRFLGLKNLPATSTAHHASGITHHGPAADHFCVWAS